MSGVFNSNPDRPGDSSTKLDKTDDAITREVSHDIAVVREFVNGDSRQTDLEKQKTAEGHAHFRRLGWKRLTIILIVEAIALGALSLPAAFATLGMVAGVILCVSIGFIAIYTSYVIGQVKLKVPGISHYADAGRAMGAHFGFPRLGYEVFGTMFVLQLIFQTGSHCLGGTIALLHIADNSTCPLILGVVSGIITFLLAVPPSFTELAILGYIDFASILLAIGITMITTGIHANHTPSNWSAWPKEGTTFSDAFIAITDIVFAYSFAICQFSFMEEMHTPTDYVKSVWSLGMIEMIIYTLTGAIIYSFVGQDVASPALISNGGVLTRVAFGVALPVIYISGAINVTVAARYIHGRMFKRSVIRFVNTKMGWLTWLGVVFGLTLTAWIIAEAIPFFADLLSISSSLFISGFTFYFPALMWFLLIKEGPWYKSSNLLLALCNGLIFIIGIIILVGGTYGAISDINRRFRDGTVHSPFTCAPLD